MCLVGHCKMAEDENRNIKFVSQVEKYPCLYNTTLSSYSRKTETERAWAEIGETMNMTGAACKEKWRNLRVVFMRHLKPLPSGSGKKKKPYYLLDYMQFLTPYVKSSAPPEAGSLPSTSLTETTEKSNATADVSNDVPTEQWGSATQWECEIEVGEPASTHSSRSPKPKRKKRSLDETEKHFINYLKLKSSRCLESQSSKDAVTSFLNSLAPELREMNLQQFKMFKRRVLSLIDDILDPPPSSSE